MLQINNLSVTVHDQRVLHNLCLTIKPGSIHVIMGPNGSGKSSLAYTLMGHPAYTINDGTLVFESTSLKTLAPDERARRGIFLAFQNPVELPGVPVFSFLKEAHQAQTGKIITAEQFRDLLYQAMDVLNIDHAFAFRGVNEGFSGGEKKRFELLQFLILKPQLALFDEIDSGLDAEALALFGKILSSAQQKNPLMSIIIITHRQKLVRLVNPDFIHIVQNGKIVHSGDHALARKIEKDGYAQLL